MNSGFAERVIIAGGGPVGLVAALALARADIPVTVYEADAAPSPDQRAISYHPPTIDMLDALGVGPAACAAGFQAPTFHLRDADEGIILSVDYSELKNELRHPYRLYLGQDRLVPILLDALTLFPHVEVLSGHRVTCFTQEADGVCVEVLHGDVKREEACQWLIGADGARSTVRKAATIDFEGFTWPELFMVTQVTANLSERGFAIGNFMRAGAHWAAMFKLTGGADPGPWRIVYPADPEIDDAVLLDPAAVHQAHRRVIGNLEPWPLCSAHPYRVHQRVATTFRTGRVLIAGDAAHVNNPLGGMGLNSGIHDVVNLAEKLTSVWRREADDSLLDRYVRQRRHAAVHTVQTSSIQNKRMMDEQDPKIRRKAYEEMRRISNDAAQRRQYMLHSTGIASLAEVEAIA